MHEYTVDLYKLSIYIIYSNYRSFQCALFQCALFFLSVPCVT